MLYLPLNLFGVEIFRFYWPPNKWERETATKRDIFVLDLSNIESHDWQSLVFCDSFNFSNFNSFILWAYGTHSVPKVQSNRHFPASLQMPLRFQVYDLEFQKTFWFASLLLLELFFAQKHMNVYSTFSRTSWRYPSVNYSNWHCTNNCQSFEN